MDLLDDDGLTNGTLTLSNSRDGTLVVACGAIAREILAINEILSWDNISQGIYFAKERLCLESIS